MSDLSRSSAGRVTARVLGLLAPLVPSVVAGEPGATAPAVLRPAAEAAIASELSARILEMPRAAGEGFATGDLLVRFDCLRLRAERDAARAGRDAAASRADTLARLDRLGATGKSDAAIAAADAEAARARLRALEAGLEGCEIRAPFDGRVVEAMAHPHEVPGAGAVLMRIVSAGPPKVEMIVPSVWLAWLDADAGFMLEIAETGQVVAGRVRRIGAEVDPISRTARVTGALDDPVPDGLLPGMSGTARLTAADG